MSSRFRGSDNAPRYDHHTLKALTTIPTTHTEEEDLDHCSLGPITIHDDVPNVTTKNDTSIVRENRGLRIDLDDKVKHTYRSRTRSTGLDNVEIVDKHTASSPVVYRRPHSWDLSTDTVAAAAAAQPPPPAQPLMSLSAQRQASVARRIVSQLWGHSRNGGGGGGGGRVERKDSNRPYQDSEPERNDEAVVVPATTTSLTSLATGTVSVVLPLPKHNYSSHTYEPDESEVWRAYTARTHHAPDTNDDTTTCAWWTVEQTYGLKRWLLTVVIGIIQAILATACNFATRLLSAWKYETVAAALMTHRSSSSSSITSSTEPEWEDNTPWLWWGDLNTTSAFEATSVQPLSSWSITWHALALFVAIQLLFALIASICVWIEPASGGSGIPEVKCCLNGIRMPRLLHGRTLLCKLIGITFSVAAGFPIGMEGPMVHSGAIVAALVCQYSSGSSGNTSNSSGGGSTNVASQWSLVWSSAWTWCTRRRRRRRRRHQGRTLDHHAQSSGIEYHRPDTDDETVDDDIKELEGSAKWQSSERGSRSVRHTTHTTRWTRLDFRNDQEQRDFVACGAAAGVCSAFGSPIGGVLFALEEASSYFSTKLTWYV
jgi:Voltage gated chloride channel